jgi:nicotinate-nucleotide--dimethylbenzimidazole phosphoribosyltransferase
MTSTLKVTLSSISPIDQKLERATRARLDRLTKPQGSLGRLEDLATRFVAMTGRLDPTIRRKVVCTFVGDHGVTAEGVSAYPSAVTPQMVFNFLRGGAGVNVLAKHVGVEVRVVDIGVAHDFGSLTGLIACKVVRGTRNMAVGPAMSRDEAIRTLEEGIAVAEEAVRDGADMLGTGDMGIGNTTPSSAITAVLTGQAVGVVTGRGTGVDDKGLERKIEVIERALAVNKPQPSDPVDVLAKVGGAEIGGIAGCILGAAKHRVPVVLDGFISGAGALIAVGLQPRCRDYLIASHRSVEQGHQAILNHLDLEPLLDLDLRLGEGTGACLGMSLVEAAVKILTQMATFDEAGVSTRTDG